MAFDKARRGCRADFFVFLQLYKIRARFVWYHGQHRKDAAYGNLGLCRCRQMGTVGNGRCAGADAVGVPELRRGARLADGDVRCGQNEGGGDPKPAPRIICDDRMLRRRVRALESLCDIFATPKNVRLRFANASIANGFAVMARRYDLHFDIARGGIDSMEESLRDFLQSCKNCFTSCRMMVKYARA